MSENELNSLGDRNSIVESDKQKSRSQRLYPEEALELPLSIDRPDTIRTKDIASIFDNDDELDPKTMKIFNDLGLVNLSSKKPLDSELEHSLISKGNLVKRVEKKNKLNQYKDDMDYIASKSTFEKSSDYKKDVNSFKKLLRASLEDIDLIKAFELFVDEIQELERLNICSGKEINIIGRLLRTLIV